jgi:hypothetical protein
MAAIDKIYAFSHNQHLEFYAWCKKNKRRCEKETGSDRLDCFYYKPDETVNYDFSGGIAIANFPEIIDRWLYFNCPIAFVTDRIVEQYGSHIETWIHGDLY